MLIYFASDLHVEYGNDFDLPTASVDLIVLGGDIGKAVMTAQWYQKESGVPVILLAGNHEYYGQNLEEKLKELRHKSAKVPNLHFLECNSIVIDSIRFLGCTLWTNFKIFGESKQKMYMDAARRCIADFRAIQYGERRLMPEDLVERFAQSYAWLDCELSKPFRGKTVVITHFSPHKAAIHPMFLQNGEDLLTPYFNSNCAELMRRHNIDLWCYGGNPP